jgi:hypothetical protein
MDGKAGMLLDRVMPLYEFHEVHGITVDAPPERVFRAIKEVMPAEVPLFRFLFTIRSLPTILAGRPDRRFARPGPLLDKALGSGFVLLGEEPHRELVVGTIGQFWRPRGGSFPPIADAGEFLAFDRPGHAKAALNFHSDGPRGNGALRLTTETRVHVPDPMARRAFAGYWGLIHAGSALTRRAWLRAIKQRAEAIQGPGILGGPR